MQLPVCEWVCSKQGNRARRQHHRHHTRSKDRRTDRQTDRQTDDPDKSIMAAEVWRPYPPLLLMLDLYHQLWWGMNSRRRDRIDRDYTALDPPCFCWRGSLCWSNDDRGRWFEQCRQFQRLHARTHARALWRLCDFGAVDKCMTYFLTKQCYTTTAVKPITGACDRLCHYNKSNKCLSIVTTHVYVCYFCLFHVLLVIQCDCPWSQSKATYLLTYLLIYLHIV